MASASHVERVPVLADDLNSRVTHVDRLWAEWISRDGQTSRDVSSEPGMGTVGGIVFNNGQAVEINILPLENSFFDRWALIGYSDFTSGVQGLIPGFVKLRLGFQSQRKRHPCSRAHNVRHNLEVRVTFDFGKPDQGILF